MTVCVCVCVCVCTSVTVASGALEVTVWVETLTAVLEGTKLVAKVEGLMLLVGASTAVELAALVALLKVVGCSECAVVEDAVVVLSTTDSVVVVLAVADSETVASVLAALLDGSGLADATGTTVIVERMTVVGSTLADVDGDEAASDDEEAMADVACVV